MGLDITGYSHIRKLNASLDDNGEIVFAEGSKPEPCFIAFLNQDFPNHAISVENSAVYGFQESTDFRAGSYIGYGNWRDELARIAGYAKDPSAPYLNYVASAWKSTSGPFCELLNFSDCEGIIGTEVSKKLAADFAEFENQASTLGESFFEKYRDFKEAFELASNCGAVRFH